MIKVLQDKIIQHTEKIFYTLGLVVAILILIL
jgi:cell division protein FtsL